MSVEGRQWALRVTRRTDLLPRAKVVASVLAERHNGKTGQCTPGQVTIARDAGVSVATTKRAVADLRDVGLIEVQSRQKKSGRGRTSDTYALLPLDGVAPRRWDQQLTSDTLVANDQQLTNDGPIAHRGTTNSSPVTDQQLTRGHEPRREPRRGNLEENLQVERAFPLNISSLTQQNGNSSGVGVGVKDGTSAAALPSYVEEARAERERKQREDAEWLASSAGQAAERRVRRKGLRPEREAA